MVRGARAPWRVVSRRNSTDDERRSVEVLVLKRITSRPMHRMRYLIALLIVDYLACYGMRLRSEAASG